MIEIIIIGVLVFVLLITIGWIIGTYNGLIAGVQNIKTQWSNILTEYQRRADLFHNIVQSVKSYAKFEKSTLKEVIEARQRSIKLDNLPSKIAQGKSMDILDNLFSKLAVVFERYPNLKGIEQYNSLMEEVRITEDRINVSRTDYNDCIIVYNLRVKTFPSSIIANMFKFVVEKFYASQEYANKRPDLKLEKI